jgi:hypothetical protein
MNCKSAKLVCLLVILSIGMTSLASAFVYETKTHNISQTIIKTHYNPSSYTLLGSTTLISGTTSDLASNNVVYMTFGSYGNSGSGSSQTLLAHEETTTIGGLEYRLLKLINADGTSTALTADASTTGRKLWGKFAYQLTGVSSIPASTWTLYYRTVKDASQVAGYADVDIIIRRSDGTIRSSIATMVAPSTAISATLSVLSGTYSSTTYTVVDQTDYLEIDYYVQITAARSGRTVTLMIDQGGLPTSFSTRADNIVLASSAQYTSAVEFTGSSNIKTWTQLVWSFDSSWTTDSVSVTIQLYNYQSGSYPTSGDGYYSYTSSTANIDETKTQTITVNPSYFRDASGNWKIKVTGAQTSSFNLSIDWIDCYVH